MSDPYVRVQLGELRIPPSLDAALSELRAALEHEGDPERREGLLASLDFAAQAGAEINTLLRCAPIVAAVDESRVALVVSAADWAAVDRLLVALHTAVEPSWVEVQQFVVETPEGPARAVRVSRLLRDTFGAVLAVTALLRESDPLRTSWWALLWSMVSSRAPDGAQLVVREPVVEVARSPIRLPPGEA